MLVVIQLLLLMILMLIDWPWRKNNRGILMREGGATGECLLAMRLGACWAGGPWKILRKIMKILMVSHQKFMDTIVLIFVIISKVLKSI